jgi:short subunit dehydrogenase-like uncharacterized protein
MADFTLTIFGATGYTGQLCVEEAVRQHIPLRIAGRRREALEALAARHASAGVPIDVVIADVEEPDTVVQLAADSEVLLSTVGPYTQFGRPVVDAAIAAGCAYLDVTGEVEFIEWVYQQADRARQTGARLAPAVGYDGVPGDLLAAVAAAALDRPVAEARVAYSIESGRVSAGTARTILAGLSRGGYAWRNGRLAQEPAGVEHWQAPFPSPPGPSSAISVPFPEVATLGRSVGARNARAYMDVPAGALVPSLAGPAQRFATLLSTTPVWGLIEKGVARLPEGPQPEQRQRAKTVVLAEVTSADGVSATRWARVNDLYGVTAVIAVEGAQRLAAGAVEPGVFTPSQVFDPEALLALIAEEQGPV